MSAEACAFKQADSGFRKHAVLEHAAGEADRADAGLRAQLLRLFDAASALCGIGTHVSFEGEGPMRLEAAASSAAGEVVELPLERDATHVWRTDWAPLLPMLTDAARPVAERAAGFHLSLAQALVEQAKQLRAQTGIRSVGLTGGVFQNRMLAEAAISRLQRAGFSIHLPRRVPVNDAGLSFGQVIEFLHA